MPRDGSLLQRLARRLADLASDSRGASAVEFAILLPFMLTLYVGGVEVSQAVSIDRKVTIIARTVADLTSQNSTITTAQMNNILNASSAVVAPYAGANMTVTVSQVNIDKNGNPTIGWSCAFQGTARPAAQAVPLCTSSKTGCIPQSLIVNGTSLIWGETQYTYTPGLGYGITGSLKLKDQIFMSPRLTPTVTGPTPC